MFLIFLGTQILFSKQIPERLKKICCISASMQHMQQYSSMKDPIYLLYHLKLSPNAKFHAFPKKEKIYNVLQITNYAAIVQQFAATWQFFHLEPILTFQGTHLLSIIQNQRRLGLKYGFCRIYCISSVMQHICSSMLLQQHCSGFPGHFQPFSLSFPIVFSHNQLIDKQVQ